MIEFGLLAAASLLFQVQTADTAELRKELKRAAIRYESISRRRAAWAGYGGGGGCDEVVGRFCLTFGDDRDRQHPEEPVVIGEARDSVIHVFNRALLFWPTDTTVAAPLVRFHIEGDSMEAAEQVAIAFDRFGGDRVWAGFLRGLVAHEAGRADAALEQFERASQLMAEEERETAWSVEDLVARDERDRVEKLAPDARAAYERRLWAYADPLYLTAGNEARAEHFARYVWGRILRRAPVVLDAFSWGDDLEEILRRFGPAAGRGRVAGRGLGSFDDIVEYFDPDLLTLTPPRMLAEGLPKPPPPPDRWPLDTIVRRSGFAPPTARSLGPLQHQLSRFHAGDSVRLRIDALMPLDSAAAHEPGRLETGVFVFDTAFNLIASQTGAGVLRGDTLVLSLDVLVPSSTPLIYSVEAREASSKLAARSRYYLDPLPVAVPLLSDLVIAQPFEAGSEVRAADVDALGRLIVPENTRVGVFAEIGRLQDDVSGYRRVNVEFEILEATEPSFLRRFGRFMGRLVGRPAAGVPRLAWSEQFALNEPAWISTSVDLTNIAPGLKLLRVTIKDPVGGTSAVTERAILIQRLRGAR